MQIRFCKLKLSYIDINVEAIPPSFKLPKSFGAEEILSVRNHFDVSAFKEQKRYK